MFFRIKTIQREIKTKEVKQQQEKTFHCWEKKNSNEKLKNSILLVYI